MDLTRALLATKFPEQEASPDLQELERRHARFVALMEQARPDWDTAIFTSHVNQYYFTGTMQNGILFIRRDGSCLYGVRRSYARAREESPIQDIAPFTSYQDLAAILGPELGALYIEGDLMPVVTLERLKKYFRFRSTGFLDPVIRKQRSVKSPYELYWTRRTAEQHRILLEEKAPAMLHEGIAETEFIGELANAMYQLGFQGLVRFHQDQVEFDTAQVGFGTNALGPTNFDGPGGGRGNSAAAPLTADGKRRLKLGDPVFLDTGFSINGYHSDKTQVYMFGADAPAELAAAHRFCLDILHRTAERLRPGEIPSKIYADILDSLSPTELDCFMGVDNSHRVKFLGHGVGLTIDELPVIAKGFDEPLEENMVIALEPKKGVSGIGMAGVEETFIVTPGGGECISGGGREIVRIPGELPGT